MFKQHRYRLTPQGAATVPHQLKQLFFPPCQNNLLSTDNMETDEVWFNPGVRMQPRLQTSSFVTF